MWCPDPVEDIEKVLIEPEPPVWQGWYAPESGEIVEEDHNQYFQYNLTNIPSPFYQEEGTIYWLELCLESDWLWGWKSSEDHWNDDAVRRGPTTNGEWVDLYEPPQFTQSLDFAFVITGEPGVDEDEDDDYYTLLVGSDDSWKTATSQTVDCPGTVGEDGPDWTTVDFDDSAWSDSLAPWECDHQVSGDVEPGVLMWMGGRPIEAFFRKSFTLSGTPVFAEAEASADDNFQMYVNGKLVAEDLDSGSGPLLAEDIAPYLEAGDNVLAFRAWDSFGGCDATWRVCVNLHVLATIEVSLDEDEDEEGDEAAECFSNDDCEPEEFCAKALGDCDGTGTCELRPEGCLAVWDPVCGCDGQTYSNACYAAMAGVSVDYLGECDSPVSPIIVEPSRGIRTKTIKRLGR